MLQNIVKIHYSLTSYSEIGQNKQIFCEKLLKRFIPFESHVAPPTDLNSLILVYYGDSNIKNLNISVSLLLLYYHINVISVEVRLYYKIIFKPFISILCSNVNKVFNDLNEVK